MKSQMQILVTILQNILMYQEHLYKLPFSQGIMKFQQTNKLKT